MTKTGYHVLLGATDATPAPTRCHQTCRTPGSHPAAVHHAPPLASSGGEFRGLQALGHGRLSSSRPSPRKDFTSVRACVRVCIRMLGAVLMHLAGRGRTAECPAVCERHCLMQLRTVLLTNATASFWGRRIRETHRPACRSLRGYRNVKVHRARQALEELPAQQWPWEETRARTHTHPDTWRACHECAAGVTWLARQAA